MKRDRKNIFLDFFFLSHRTWRGAGIWGWGCRVVLARGGVVFMCAAIGGRVLPYLSALASVN